MLKRTVYRCTNDPLGVFLEQPRIVQIDEVNRVVFAQHGLRYSTVYVEHRIEVRLFWLRLKRWVDVAEFGPVRTKYGRCVSIDVIHDMSDAEVFKLALDYYRQATSQEGSVA